MPALRRRHQLKFTLSCRCRSIITGSKNGRDRCRWGRRLLRRPWQLAVAVCFASCAVSGRSSRCRRADSNCVSCVTDALRAGRQAGISWSHRWRQRRRHRCSGRGGVRRRVYEPTKVHLSGGRRQPPHSIAYVRTGQSSQGAENAASDVPSQRQRGRARGAAEPAAGAGMKSIRTSRPRIRRERSWPEDLPADPRDPDVVRAKALARARLTGPSRTSRAR
jgi:hypothetical protein